MVSTAKVNKLRNTEIDNNEDLKEYLTTLRSVLYDLYIDISFTAEVLRSSLANIKGIKNNFRARLVAGSLNKVAELLKSAAGGTAATWRTFEQQFSSELEAAPSSKRKPAERFKIV